MENLQQLHDTAAKLFNEQFDQALMNTKMIRKHNTPKKFESFLKFTEALGGVSVRIEYDTVEMEEIHPDYQYNYIEKYYLTAPYFGSDNLVQWVYRGMTNHKLTKEEFGKIILELIRVTPILDELFVTNHAKVEFNQTGNEFTVLLRIFPKK